MYIEPICIVKNLIVQQQPFSNDHKLFYVRIHYIDFTTETWY